MSVFLDISVHNIAKAKLTNMKQTDSEEKFVPKGAMTFFLLLMGLMAAIWYSIYIILLN